MKKCLVLIQLCESGSMELTPSTFGGGVDGNRGAWGLGFSSELPDGNDLCLDGADLYNLAVVRPTGGGWSSKGLQNGR